MQPWILAAISGAMLICIGLALRTRGRVTGHGRGSMSLQVALLALSLLGLAALWMSRKSAPAPQQEMGSEWHQVGGGITEGISGLALVEQNASSLTLLAVHDNKEPGQKRLSLIHRDAVGVVATRAVSWKDEPLAIDLEAVCRMPGDASFLALTSRGALYRLNINVAAAEATFAGPPAGVPNSAEDRQFEALDVQLLGAQTVACWAERGGDNGEAGVIFCARFEPATMMFGNLHTAAVHGPAPPEHARHVADLRILPDGALLAASASDPDNAGPFTGAIYVAGLLTAAADGLQLSTSAATTPLFSTTHKIEAIEVVPGTSGGLVIGSDDENHGGAVRFGWDPPRRENQTRPDAP